MQAVPNTRPRALPREEGAGYGWTTDRVGVLYTYYRVRKLRSEERLAAITRGAAIPVEPELNQAARSRRAGILLVSGAIGYILTFGLIAQIQADRDIWTAAALGIVPLAVGIGYFVDWKLIHRDARTS